MDQARIYFFETLLTVLAACTVATIFLNLLFGQSDIHCIFAASFELWLVKVVQIQYFGQRGLFCKDLVLKFCCLDVVHVLFELDGPGELLL